MFYQIFLSPQVKRYASITYKHGIYELPNDLRLKGLRKLRNIRKVPRLHSPMPSPPAEMETPPILAKHP